MSDDFIKPRNLLDVINGVIKLLPDNSLHKLRAELLDIMEDIRYIAPENIYLCWFNFSVALTRYLKYPPTENFEREIYRLVTLEEPPFEEVRIE
jgi:hypothetical protein